jgi:hypothetical protein
MSPSRNVTNISGCCNIWTGPRHVWVVKERARGGGERFARQSARPCNYGNKTKPKRVTGAASNGTQPGRIITRSSTPFYPALPPALLIYSNYERAFSYTKEKKRKGSHDIDGEAAVGDSEYSDSAYSHGHKN